MDENACTEELSLFLLRIIHPFFLVYLGFFAEFFLYFIILLYTVGGKIKKIKENLKESTKIKISLEELRTVTRLTTTTLIDWSVTVCTPVMLDSKTVSRKYI